jgi:hypothetical protein
MLDSRDNSRFWTDVAVFCVTFIITYLLSGVVTGASIVLNIVAVGISLLLATIAVYTLKSDISDGL